MAVSRPVSCARIVVLTSAIVLAFAWGYRVRDDLHRHEHREFIPTEVEFWLVGIDIPLEAIVHEGHFAEGNLQDAWTE